MRGFVQCGLNRGERILILPAEAIANRGKGGKRFEDIALVPVNGIARLRGSASEVVRTGQDVLLTVPDFVHRNPLWLVERLWQ
jgi:hypothetical protein